MEPRARHVAIGVFVLFLAALGFGVALWLGDARSDRDFHYYRVMFDEPVTGLSIGSPVQYSGITVGEVAALSLLPRTRAGPSPVCASRPRFRFARTPGPNW